MTPSKEELIDVVRKYYGSSNAFVFTTEPIPETKRLDDTWKRWIANMEPWYAFQKELSSVLPDFLFGATYPSMDGGPRCMACLPRGSWSPTSNWTVVGCVSLLAPVYFVYFVEWDFIGGHRGNFRARFEPPPSRMAWLAQVMARTIEKRFGFSALPRELADTHVPLYAGLLEPSKTTLFHTLFTNDPCSIP